MILGFAGIAFWNWYDSKKRRELLGAWAVGKGWRFQPGKVSGPAAEYPGLKFFDRGHSRSACNIISGEHNGRSVRLMDYRYVTGSGKSRTTHHVGVLIMRTDFPTIPLTIRRENPFDKVTEFFGADDIDFESAEFSRKFYVKSNDRKWAYDVIHQRTMDFLLASPSYEIAFGMQEIAITKSRKLSPQGYDEALALATGFYDLVPDYVIRQMNGAAD